VFGKVFLSRSEYRQLFFPSLSLSSSFWACPWKSFYCASMSAISFSIRNMRSWKSRAIRTTQLIGCCIFQMMTTAQLPLHVDASHFVPKLNTSLCT
jgi:hypothetical protein